MRTEAEILTRGPYGANWRARAVLCSDGKRRSAEIRGSGYLLYNPGSGKG